MALPVVRLREDRGREDEQSTARRLPADSLTAALTYDKEYDDEVHPSDSSLPQVQARMDTEEARGSRNVPQVQKP
jgi:hypothetical protein